jgi:hypothetical protein
MVNIFNWLTSIFRDKKESADNYIWCLIGNVVEKHDYGEEHELRYGSKHFSAGAKVYCFPVQWGDGYENIRVIGRHRKSGRMVTIIMPSKHINNWQMKKVYEPHIIKLMQQYRGWTASKEDEKRILSMLPYLTAKPK